MQIDREIFYRSVRPIFGGSLNQSQVDGMGALLQAWQKFGDDDARKLAYTLATFFHETSRHMSPVIETYQPGKDKTMPSVDTAIARLESSWKKGKLSWVKTPYWRKDEDGLSWLGRGGPQVTHKPNYVKAEKLTGIPFSKKPERMLEADPAAEVAVRMMMRGQFTGKKLGDYLNDKVTDYKGARYVINGQESAAKVAGYAKQFYPAVLAAMVITARTDVVAVPPPPPEAKPTRSVTNWAAAAGAGVPGVLTAAKATSDYVNSKVIEIKDTAGQVKETVTIVRDNVDSFSGWLGYLVTPPVLIAFGIVTVAAVGFFIVSHSRLMKEASQ